MSKPVITKALIEQLADSETALVCNALDTLHVAEPHTYYLDGDIACHTPDLPSLVGEVITIGLDSSTAKTTGDVEPYWRMLEEISKSEVRRVVVVKSTGDNIRRACVMGDGMAKTFISVGAVGMVTDGGVRDLDGIIQQGFGVFCSGRVVQHTQLHWSMLGEPMNLGGITIKSGDLIHGDSDGCIVVPSGAFDRIVPACALVLAFEKRAHVLLRQSEISLQEKRSIMKTYVEDLQRKIAAIEPASF